MITALRRYAVALRLTVFLAVTVLALGYLGLRYVGLDRLLDDQYTVHAQFADSGGIFSGAEIDVRGIQVGTVGDLHVSGDGVRVDLDIDDGVRIPADLTATVSDRSALGEQFVQLEPRTDHGPYLRDGSVIARTDTAIPVPTQTLLAHLDALARSVPKAQLRDVLRELGTTFDGLGPDLRSLLDSTTTISSAALADLKNTISLLDDSRTVLDTQVASAAAIGTASVHLASLSTAVRALDPTLARLLVSGTSAAQQVTGLLDDTQQALPVLLNNLVTVTQVVAGRTPQLRKLLATFPKALEEGLTLVRPCDAYHADGTPVAGSCHYDLRTGKPIYSAHFGFQLSNTPLVCTKGYEGTTKYLPNGKPASGYGPDESNTAKANVEAGCTASPTSSTPNVRGAQNAQDVRSALPDTSFSPGGDPSDTAAYSDTAYSDPLTGATVTDGGSYFSVTPATAAVPADLGQLLIQGLP